MRHTLIPLDKQEEWTAALQGIPHAFGHTWESCYAMHLTTNQPTYLYVFEQDGTRVVCPIAERTIDGYTDIVTPYGFSGFASNGEVTDFQNHWKQFAREAGYVCGYIGLNPLFEKRTLIHGEPASEYNTLFILDLTQPIETLFSNLSSSRKKQLRNFQKYLPLFTTEKSILKPFFIDNFNRFFAEKNASSVYCFSTETLAFLADLENVRMVGVEQEGKVVAVSVFSYTPFTAEHLFNISLPEGRPYSVPMIWWAVTSFQSMQVPRLNLGGGNYQGDSLTDFKVRFGAEQYPLKSLKQVYNDEAFTKLCETYHVVPSTEGYFPAYRKPNQMTTNSLVT